MDSDPVESEWRRLGDAARVSGEFVISWSKRAAAESTASCRHRRVIQPTTMRLPAIRTGDSRGRRPRSELGPAGALPAPHACDARCRSRQPNTHNTESREVCYPWHPWFGRAVAVYEVLVKQGHSVCRCGLEEERNRRSLEVPTWMFEPAACGRLRLMASPAVSCDALRALKALLRHDRASGSWRCATSPASFLACRRRC